MADNASRGDTAVRPNLLLYLAYCYGKVLPEQYRDWVRADLTGRGARTRTLIRITLPALLCVAPLWLFPASLGMHLAMALFIVLPLIFYAHALDRFWRAYRLRRHGLDPDLVDERARLREAEIRRDYRRRHGHDDPDGRSGN